MQVYVSKYWNRVANMRRKPTCIFILSGKPSAVLKLLEQYGCPDTCTNKNLHSAESDIAIPNDFLKHVLGL